MQKVRKLAVVFTICSEFLPLLFAHPLFLHSKSIHGGLANKRDRLYDSPVFKVSQHTPSLAGCIAMAQED